MTNNSLLDPFTQQSESANCHRSVVEKVTQRLGIFVSIFLTKKEAGHFMRKMLKSPMYKTFRVLCGFGWIDTWSAFSDMEMVKNKYMFKLSVLCPVLN